MFGLEMVLVKLAAGLLASAGVITVDEAREMAGMEHLSEAQKRKRVSMLKWCKQTGVPLPPSWWDIWEG